MDRRMFLAFGLIFLILIGSQALMQKMYPAPENPAGADSTLVLGPDTGRETVYPDSSLPISSGHEVDTIPAPERGAAEEFDFDDPLASGPVSRESAESLLAGAPESTIQVTTPLYRLSISTAGGRVIRWETFEHNSHLGEPVQLIPEEIPLAGLDALVFRHGEIALGAARYETDQAFDMEMSASGGSRSLTLKVKTAGGLEIHKIFTFNPEVYGYDVDFLLVGVDPLLADQSLVLLGPPEDFRFGWNQGVLPTERVQKMELPSLRSVALVGDELYSKKRDKLKKGAENVSGQWKGSAHYAGLQTRYFTALGIVPQDDGVPVEGTIRLGGDQELMAQSWSIDVPARPGIGSEIATSRLQFFVGPQETKLLESYGRNLEGGMDLGWKWIRPLSVVVLKGMEWMHRFIPNYGWIIIIFSILTKLMFYPLTRTSTQSMKKMQELQPKLKALQAKHKDDKDKLNAATMNLYKEEKVNPLAGCLPILLQSPVFIALYQSLSHTISLRGQPFMGWITDLSQPDAIATMPVSLPFLGSDLNVLPILMSVAMYFQTKLTPSTGGGQMAAMNTMMPLFMVFIFYNMPSGLVLYWLVNTIMQAYQSWRIQKTAKVDGGVQTS
ncbi:MAG: membrane protein insertase YidC [Gemmatimonadales bacterium]|nr:membrane protein insertase YidC [Gemmatimonadales bacterium]